MAGRVGLAAVAPVAGRDQLIAGTEVTNLIRPLLAKPVDPATLAEMQIRYAQALSIELLDNDGANAALAIAESYTDEAGDRRVALKARTVRLGISFRGERELGVAEAAIPAADEAASLGEIKHELRCRFCAVAVLCIEGKGDELIKQSRLLLSRAEAVPRSLDRAEGVGVRQYMGAIRVLDSCSRPIHPKSRTLVHGWDSRTR